MVAGHYRLSGDIPDFFKGVFTGVFLGLLILGVIGKGPMRRRSD